MNRASDAAIARAFDWALVSLEAMTPWCTVYRRIKERAAEFDAESPAGTERGSEEVMQIDLDRSEEGNAVARGEEGKTSPLCSMFTINETPCLPDGVVVFSQGGEIKGVMHAIPEKVTTSPERVQIPAESTHVRCPKCTAHMPVGKWCGGAQCPLRK